MIGEVNLTAILRALKPELHPGEFVYCSVAGVLPDIDAVLSFREVEGWTLIVARVKHFSGFSVPDGVSCEPTDVSCVKSVVLDAVIPEQYGLVDLPVNRQADLAVALARCCSFQFGDALFEIGAAVAAEVCGRGGGWLRVQLDP